MGYIKLIFIAIIKKWADINTKNTDGNTVLMISAKNGQTEILKRQVLKWIQKKLFLSVLHQLSLY